MVPGFGCKMNHSIISPFLNCSKDLYSDSRFAGVDNRKSVSSASSQIFISIISSLSKVDLMLIRDYL